MPLNCPVCYPYECKGCRYLWEDKCNYYMPARPLTEILTTNERITLLERQPQPQAIGYKQLNNRFDRWMGLVVKLQKDINKHLDKTKEYLDKKKGKYKKYV